LRDINYLVVQNGKEEWWSMQIEGDNNTWSIKKFNRMNF
jgi:hypothetical protein